MPNVPLLGTQLLLSLCSGASLTLAGPGGPWHCSLHLPTETFQGTLLLSPPRLSRAVSANSAPAIVPFHHAKLSGQLANCRGEAELPGAAEPSSGFKESPRLAASALYLGRGKGLGTSHTGKFEFGLNLDRNKATNCKSQGF